MHKSQHDQDNRASNQASKPANKPSGEPTGKPAGHQDASSLSLPDMQLTSYALGELDGPEHADARLAVEARLRSVPVDRQQVDAIRATAGQVGDAFAGEPAMSLSFEHRAAIDGYLQTLEQAELAEQVMATPPRARVAHPFDERGRRSWLIAVSAAALFMLGGAVGIFYASYQRARSSLLNGGGQPNLVKGDLGSKPYVRTRPGRTFAGGAATSAHNLTRADGPLMDNPFVTVKDSPLSGFAAKVSDEAYQRLLEDLDLDRLPTREDVRIEEYVNAFDYSYDEPTDKLGFASHAEVRPCPWNPKNRLARIGLKGAKPGDIDKIAKDLAISVEFNPKKVAAFRLIGFENRPKTDGRSRGGDEAGKQGDTSIDAGHEVTALYEIVPADRHGQLSELTPLDQLRYQQPRNFTAAANSNELFTVRLEYQPVAQADTGKGGGPDQVGEPAPRVEQYPVADAIRFRDGFEPASPDFKFAAAVASYGMILRDSPYKGNATLGKVVAEAGDSVHRKLQAASTTEFKDLTLRQQFIAAVKKTQTLMRDRNVD